MVNYRYLTSTCLQPDTSQFLSIFSDSARSEDLEMETLMVSMGEKDLLRFWFDGVESDEF